MPISACLQWQAAPVLRHAAAPPAQVQCRRQRLCGRQLFKTQRREHGFVVVASATSQPAATSTELPQLLPLDGAPSGKHRGCGRHAKCTLAANPQRDARVMLAAENYEVAHTFASYASWLIRGRLMLGRYPFVEPSRCV